MLYAPTPERVSPVGRAAIRAGDDTEGHDVEEAGDGLEVPSSPLLRLPSLHILPTMPVASGRPATTMRRPRAGVS